MLKVDNTTQFVIDPADHKTLWRQNPADRAEEPGKIMHPKLVSLYKEYLKRHRPILMKNLGERAKFDLTFTEEKHGPGAGKCMTLFPGYWDLTQTHRFVSKSFQKVLVYSERGVRNALGVAMSINVARDWGIPKEAVYQQFHHSEQVHGECYLRGLRNQVNELQAHLLGW